MAANSAVSTGHLEQSHRRRLRSWSLPQIKRRQRPLKGGEAELLRKLGDLPRLPNEPGLPVDRTLARWRWM